MKKIKLNLDDLKVESFVTTPEAGGVQGYSCPSCAATCATCDATCPYTCPPSCDTCPFTDCSCPKTACNPM